MGCPTCMSARKLAEATFSTQLARMPRSKSMDFMVILWWFYGNMVGIWWEYDKDKRIMIECLGFEWCIYIYSTYNDIDCWHPCYSCLGHASQPSRAQKELEGPLDSSFFPCPSPDSLAAAIARLSSVAAQTSNVTFQKPQWAHLQSSKGAGVALPRFRWRPLDSHPCQWHAASSAGKAWK